MENVEEDAFVGRVTRSRLRRTSLDSEAPNSRPGTPIASKLTAITESSDDAVQRPVRMTRRNSITSALSTPKKTSRSATLRTETPDLIGSPARKSTRKRNDSIAEEDQGFAATAAIKIAAVKGKQINDPRSLAEKCTKRSNTKSSPPSAVASSNENSNSPKSENQCSIKKSKSKKYKKSDDINSNNDTVEVVNFDTEDEDAPLNKQIEIIMVIDDNDKGKNIVEVKHIDDTQQGKNETTNQEPKDENAEVVFESVPDQSIVLTNNSQNTNNSSKDISFNDSKHEQNKTAELFVEDSETSYSSDAHTTPSQTKNAEKLRIPQLDILAPETMIKLKISPYNSPVYNKQHSLNAKSVAFNSSNSENVVKCAYPRTPGLKKSKSYIDTDFSKETSANHSYQCDQGSEASFKDVQENIDEEFLPETQEVKQEQQDQCSGLEFLDISNDKEAACNVYDDNLLSENTPHKAPKLIENVQSSTPLLDVVTKQKPTEEKTTAAEAQYKLHVSLDLHEKSLRSGKRFGESPNSSTKLLNKSAIKVEVSPKNSFEKLKTVEATEFIKTVVKAEIETRRSTYDSSTRVENSLIAKEEENEDEHTPIVSSKRNLRYASDDGEEDKESLPADDNEDENTKDHDKDFQEFMVEEEKCQHKSRPYENKNGVVEEADADNIAVSETGEDALLLKFSDDEHLQGDNAIKENSGEKLKKNSCFKRIQTSESDSEAEVTEVNSSKKKGLNKENQHNEDAASQPLVLEVTRMIDETIQDDNDESNSINARIMLLENEVQADNSKKINSVKKSKKNRKSSLQSAHTNEQLNISNSRKSVNKFNKTIGTMDAIDNASRRSSFDHDIQNKSLKFIGQHNKTGEEIVMQAEADADNIIASDMEEDPLLLKFSEDEYLQGENAIEENAGDKLKKTSFFKLIQTSGSDSEAEVADVNSSKKKGLNKEHQHNEDAASHPLVLEVTRMIDESMQDDESNGINASIMLVEENEAEVDKSKKINSAKKSKKKRKSLLNISSSISINKSTIIADFYDINESAILVEDDVEVENSNKLNLAKKNDNMKKRKSSLQAANANEQLNSSSASINKSSIIEDFGDINESAILVEDDVEVENSNELNLAKKNDKMKKRKSSLQAANAKEQLNSSTASINKSSTIEDFDDINESAILVEDDVEAENSNELNSVKKNDKKKKRNSMLQSTNANEQLNSSTASINKSSTIEDFDDINESAILVEDDVEAENSNELNSVKKNDKKKKRNSMLQSTNANEQLNSSTASINKSSTIEDFDDINESAILVEDDVEAENSNELNSVKKNDKKKKRNSTLQSTNANEQLNSSNSRKSVNKFDTTIGTTDDIDNTSIRRSLRRSEPKEKENQHNEDTASQPLVLEVTRMVEENIKDTDELNGINASTVLLEDQIEAVNSKKVNSVKKSKKKRKSSLQSADAYEELNSSNSCKSVNKSTTITDNDEPNNINTSVVLVENEVEAGNKELNSVKKNDKKKKRKSSLESADANEQLNRNSSHRKSVNIFNKSMGTTCDIDNASTQHTSISSSKRSSLRFSDASVDESNYCNDIKNKSLEFIGHSGKTDDEVAMQANVNNDTAENKLKNVVVEENILENSQSRRISLNQSHSKKQQKSLLSENTLKNNCDIDLDKVTENSKILKINESEVSLSQSLAKEHRKSILNDSQLNGEGKQDKVEEKENEMVEGTTINESVPENEQTKSADNDKQQAKINSESEQLATIDERNGKIQAEKFKHKRLSKSVCDDSTTPDNTLADDVRHLHKKSKIVEDTKDEAKLVVEDRKLKKSASTRLKQSPLGGSDIARILSRCEEILDAANSAKLKAKINCNKFHKKSSKRPKPSNIEPQETELKMKNDEDKIFVPLVGHKHSDQRKKNTELAPTQVILTQPPLGMKKDMAMPKINEDKRAKKCLPQEVLESLTDATGMQVQRPPVPKKKRKLESHNIIEQENLTQDHNRHQHQLISNIGNNMTAAKNKPKKKTHITKIELATGTVSVEPATPRKLTTADVSSALRENAPTRRTAQGFKVRHKLSAGQQDASSSKWSKPKRPIKGPTHSPLAKPQWTQSGHFIEEKLNEPINAGALNFKRKQMLRKDIPRESTRVVLQRKQHVNWQNEF